MEMLGGGQVEDRDRLCLWFSVQERLGAIDVFEIWL